MNSLLLFIDTETGGIDPSKHSLLSIGLVLWDATIDTIILSKEFFIKNDHYSVTKTAQKLNHFTKQHQDNYGVDEKVVIQFFSQINEKYFNKKGISLAGHNPQFDIQFIKKMYKENNRSYEKTFSHRVIDTYSILHYLYDQGKLTLDNNSSASAFSHFRIHVDGRHTALGDAKATLELYKKLLLI